MGRPPIEIDMAKLEMLMRFKPTLSDTAAFFQCHEDTIERRIKEQFDCSFTEYRERAMVHTRMSLIQKALSRSEKSDTMLIFCLKHLCGWTDGSLAIINNNNSGESKTMTAVVSEDKLVELIKTARGKS